MSAHPHQDPDLDQDLALLRDIAEITTDVARILHRQLQANPTLEHDPANTFERLARAVRRTIHLRQHLRQNSLAKTTQRTATRADIIRRVENTIDRTVRDPARAESLQAELVERLEAPEFEHEIQTRPPADIAADILRDLGLANPNGLPATKRRTPTDLRALYAQAARQPTRPTPQHQGQSLLDYLLDERRSHPPPKHSLA